MSDSNISTTIASILTELTTRSQSDPSVLHYVLLDKIKINPGGQEPLETVDCPEPDCLFPVSTYKVMSEWTSMDTQNLMTENVIVYFTRIDIDSKSPISDSTTWDIYTKNPNNLFTRTRNTAGTKPLEFKDMYYWDKNVLTSTGIMVRRVDEEYVSYPEIYGEKPIPTVMGKDVSDDPSAPPIAELFRDDSASINFGRRKQKLEGGRKKKSKKLSKRKRKSKKTKRSKLIK